MGRQWLGRLERLGRLEELEATGYWIDNGIWTIGQRSLWRRHVRRSGDTGPEQGLEWRKIPVISMDKIVSLLQWHSFIRSMARAIQHHSFDSTGEALGDPYTKMSLRLRDLSHEGMACLEGGVVSWFQATTPWFPIRPSAARHCHDFHTHVDIHLHSHYSVHSRNPHSFWVHTPLPDIY